EKCKFHVTETEFLGFIILRKEILVNLKKLSFLEFVNFYRKFIKGYLKITTPLIELTKKDNKFN
ncbi:hypothetical protein K469DRAFT_546444, partial [Zopfia rhizophila CBS 207.26]